MMSDFFSHKTLSTCVFPQLSSLNVVKSIPTQEYRPVPSYIFVWVYGVRNVRCIQILVNKSPAHFTVDLHFISK